MTGHRQALAIAAALGFLSVCCAGSDVERSTLAVGPRIDLLRQWVKSSDSDESATTDLVVARDGEDTHWIGSVRDEYQGKSEAVRIHVYDSVEGTALNSPDELKPGVHIHRITNAGLEAQSYLQHIVSSYDKLAYKTVFTQGRMPSPGDGHKHGAGHLHPQSDFLYDYLCPCTPPVYLPTCMPQQLSNQQPPRARSALSSVIYDSLACRCNLP